jgi:hypothetical protein
MSRVKLVAIPCQLYPGAFSSERVFEVILQNGEKHQGLAPRYFCWNENGELIGAEEATDGLAGFVAAKLLDRGEIGYAAVEVPDGEVLAVSPELVRDRPTQIQPPELPPLAEGKPSHVFVGS